LIGIWVSPRFLHSVGITDFLRLLPATAMCRITGQGEFNTLELEHLNTCRFAASMVFWCRYGGGYVAANGANAPLA